MKKLLLISVVIILNNTLTFCQTDQKNITGLKGQYLVKNLRKYSRAICTGIISRDGYFERSAAIFSPDGRGVLVRKTTGARY